MKGPMRRRAHGTRCPADNNRTGVIVRCREIERRLAMRYEYPALADEAMERARKVIHGVLGGRGLWPSDHRVKGHEELPG